jgi:ketosteroid isomerase-like protein
MPRFILGCLLSLLALTPAVPQTAGTPADHDALRKLKADATQAVNTRDYPAAQKLLHQPFMATLVTQDNFTNFDKLKAYFENLYTRDFLRMKHLTIAAEADDLSQIFEGTFSINKGSTKEHYELADGRVFDMDGRWTAVSLKENGEWKLLAVHSGTNFLDNPVLTAVEKSIIWFATGGVGVGLLIGFAAGWLLRRRRVMG